MHKLNHFIITQRFLHTGVNPNDMSSTFLEVFEKGHVFEAETPPEIRLYYDGEGKILDVKYVKKNIKQDEKYIVITQEQYDGLNRKSFCYRQRIKIC